jgi:hypothetical protein
MTTNAQAAVRAAAPRGVLRPTAPSTLQERLHLIEELRKRINGYIDFMCQDGPLAGASAEARDRAVALFCEEMAVVERRLGRIEEDLRLA